MQYIQSLIRYQLISKRPKAMASGPKRKIVLHISNNENDQYLVKRTIKSVDASLMLRQVETPEDAVEFLDQAKLFNDLPCIIILDISATINEQAAYEEIRKDKALKEIPVVVFYTAAEIAGINKRNRRKIIFTERPAIYKEFAKSIIKALSYCQ